MAWSGLVEVSKVPVLVLVRVLVLCLLYPSTRTVIYYIIYPFRFSFCLSVRFWSRLLLWLSGGGRIQRRAERNRYRYLLDLDESWSWSGGFCSNFTDMITMATSLVTSHKKRSKKIWHIGFQIFIAFILSEIDILRGVGFL